MSEPTGCVRCCARSDICDLLVRLPGYGHPGRPRKRHGDGNGESLVTHHCDLTRRRRVQDVSLKVRCGPPIDDPEDLELPHWAASCPWPPRLVSPSRPGRDLDSTVAVPQHVAA